MRKSFIRHLKPVSFQSKLLMSYIMIIMISVLAALLIYGVNLYNQTKGYYEDLLNEFSNRTNVIISDFISNVSLNSFFYLTDPKLQSILNKRYQLESREHVEDTLYVQRAMDQLVLMNGNISTISVMAPNGRVYTSMSAFEPGMKQTIDRMNKQELLNGNIVISPPYENNTKGNKDKQLSIVRYLTDINMNKAFESYVKIDIRFRALQNILGGIANSNNELGTIVIMDGKVIYHSNLPSEALDSKETQDIAAFFDNQLSDGKKFQKLYMNQESYLFSARVNDMTKWKVIHYIPTRLIDQAFLNNTRNYILLSLISLIAAFILALFFSKRFIKPIHKLNSEMKLVDSGYLDRVPIHENRVDEISRLVASYNEMIHRLKESRELEIVSGQLQKRAEMNMLQAQINPHFLYNTLNVIHSVAELNRVSDISTMARSLSDMYRYNIKTGDEATIHNELEQIKNYIGIQQIRFLGKFQVVYEIEEDLLPYKILKFLLQPLVENSFYHGLEPKGGKGTLIISITKKGHLLHIRVEDDGVGMNEQKLAELNVIFSNPFQTASLDSKDNFGLRNVHARIKNFYGEDYWIKLSSALQTGTCIEMTIPGVKEMNADENTGGR
ncbi:HAMP domain-containing protein [Paenibacillus sp. LMG 31456]|uniref:HAMP domain-containing protein n=1 Tax=Paenibacillus foliorum TaxID=2654974 RepID=A0A972GQL2_9BACL|nr:sensor histidine kinase [Paenibacillus foliorum]NOU94992.1 HAMP domain-containing protein [Paenibacillus foliorum]